MGWQSRRENGAYKDRVPYPRSIGSAKPSPSRLPPLFYPLEDPHLLPVGFTVAAVGVLVVRSGPMVSPHRPSGDARSRVLGSPACPRALHVTGAWTVLKACAIDCASAEVMTTNASQRVQRHRDRLRAAGLRPVQIWVPDTTRPGFAEECRR